MHLGYQELRNMLGKFREECDRCKMVPPSFATSGLSERRYYHRQVLHHGQVTTELVEEMSIMNVAIVSVVGLDILTLPLANILTVKTVTLEVEISRLRSKTRRAILSTSNTDFRRQAA